MVAQNDRVNHNNGKGALVPAKQSTKTGIARTVRWLRTNDA